MTTKTPVRNEIDISMSGIVPDNLIQKYDKQKNSFYTFYPMLGLWDEKVGFSEFKSAWKSRIKENPKEPFQLYLHFPYCPTQCVYCQCAMVASKDINAYSTSVDFMIKEIEILNEIFNEYKFKPNVAEIHFGGGSPSVIPKEDFERLFDALGRIIDISKVSEIAIEIDPRKDRLQKDILRYYASKGINRISFGIQDFDFAVLKAINRAPFCSYEDISDLLKPDIRKLFKNGINFDLIYGMPFQTLDSWETTMDQVLKIKPDRLAVLTYGHRPEVFPHQKVIKGTLPSDELKNAMFNLATNKLTGEGYERIGIDYFALPHDALAISKKNGTLCRNGLGHTPGRAHEIIGIGPSCQMIINNNYFQNYFSLDSYYASLEKGLTPIVRGWMSSRDDIIRRKIIFDYINKQKVSIPEIEEMHNINFNSYFKDELSKLEEFVADGILIIDKEFIHPTTIGRFFLRQVCEVFDKVFHAKGYKHSRDYVDGRRSFTTYSKKAHKKYIQS